MSVSEPGAPLLLRPCPCGHTTGRPLGDVDGDWYVVCCASCDASSLVVWKTPYPGETPRNLSLRERCKKCKTRRGVALPKGPPWVVRCARCHDYSHNASEAEIFASSSLPVQAPAQEATRQTLPGRASPSASPPPQRPQMPPKEEPALPRTPRTSPPLLRFARPETEAPSEPCLAGLVRQVLYAARLDVVTETLTKPLDFATEEEETPPER